MAANPEGVCNERQQRFCRTRPSVWAFCWWALTFFFKIVSAPDAELCVKLGRCLGHSLNILGGLEEHAKPPGWGLGLIEWTQLAP